MTVKVGFMIYDLGFAGRGRCASACTHPPSYFRHPTSSRRGISLLEVLISIGIVAIGLVSVAALIPVGGIQAMKADIEQRKAETGLNIIREFKTRGMGIVEPNANCPWVRYNGTNWVQYSFPPAAADMLPLAIDPLMAAAAGTTAAARGVIKDFPANAGAGVPTMSRLTLNTAAIFATPNFTPNLPLADAIFRADDDIVIFQPSDAAQTALAYDPSLATPPLKQDSLGLYSWLAMLTPYYPDPNAPAVPVTPAAGVPCTLSVVVFYRRSLPNPTAFSAGAVREGTATVTPSGSVAGSDYFAASGGDVKLTTPLSPGGPYTSSNPNPLSYARPGNWLMLARPAVTTGPIDHQYPVMFSWYRVVAGDVIDEASALTEANVTLAGPDWVFAAGNSPQTYACLFDDVVAVYQRTIELEGPSKWSQ